MQSRRNFLGLLAAAPVIGPAVAKEVMAAPHYASGGWIRGYTSSFTVGEAGWLGLGTTFDAFSDGSIRAPKLSVELMQPAPTRDEPALWSRLFDVPNRIYGTTINSEGDAI